MQHPNIRRLHILCLSDGEDSASDNQAITAAQHLLRFNVVLDSVMIAYRNGELKALSVLSGMLLLEGELKMPRKSYWRKLDSIWFASALSCVAGGHAFAPETYSDAVRIFEMETLIDLGARAEPERLFPFTAVKTSTVARSEHRTLSTCPCPSLYCSATTLELSLACFLQSRSG